jgi:DNA-binding GntR family transcriptional regulator
MVSRNTSLVNQVILEIINDICCDESGRTQTGLPSEAELSQRFDVSRATVREALAKLEDGGAVVRRHGVGTFISPMASSHRSALQGWFAERPNFLDMIDYEGFRPACRLLALDIVPAGQAAPHLEIDPADRAVRIERIFLADGVPVIHSVNFVSLALLLPGERETACASFSCEESIYEFLERRCGCSVEYHQSEVRAVVAGDELASRVECSSGDPLLCLEEIGYDLKIKPVWYAINSFRGDAASFVQMGNPMACFRAPH